MNVTSYCDTLSLQLLMLVNTAMCLRWKYILVWWHILFTWT